MTDEFKINLQQQQQNSTNISNHERVKNKLQSKISSLAYQKVHYQKKTKSKYFYYWFLRAQPDENSAFVFLTTKVL